MKKFGLLLLLCALLSRAGAVPLSFSFYGAPVQLELPASLMQQPALKLAPDKSALEQRIRNWNAGDLEALVFSIQASARLMFLDDVATGRLIHACAQQLYGDGSDAVLFEWLLLRYASYDAVLGYGGTMKVYVQYAFLTEGTQFVLFMGKKYTLPQGEPEKKNRVVNMVAQMDKEGFGSCTNTYSCEAECPKGISVANIARLNREYLAASLSGEN